MPPRKFRHFELYEAIKAKGDWITRPELADAIKKRVLAPNDMERLAELVKDGYIEQDNFYIGGRVFYRYRIPAGAPELIED